MHTRNNMDTYSFRAGWRRGMVCVSAGDTNAEFKQAVLRDHTEDYAKGFVAALDHFDGHVTHGTDLAYDLGLVSAYSDFYGQPGYEHPIELPGHS